ncbi:hypothetical protein CKAH01_04573 [Colletotrichum kahawae]|uniref:Uncharacterized protein n=1 Tax=Colletotrichum kahawae TaxID=34407 RepID=A0AAD9YJ16_COLKA|nr:hypothetical protein CKAH01_04573 [Colletotrichum kahawae]
MRGDFPGEFEGFDEEQEMKLKDKKRKRGESNEEKWKDIFNVLFPDAIETSNLYYRSRAIENCQDEIADPDDMKHGIIKNLFADHQAPDIESMARSRMEKMTGSLPEEDWREMKKIFRDFAFAGLESQTSVCSSSKFSASHQVPNTRLNSGQDSREILNHEDALPPESQPQLPLPTREAAEHSPDPHLEATSETYEESVFNNLNLTPEECLAAALQQKTPPWQGPEDVSSHY